MKSTGSTFSVQQETKSPYACMKQAARWLLGRVQSSLLVALLIYKLLTVFAFVPLMQQVWATALRFSPTQYITTDNLTGLLRSPTLLAAILIIVICTAWWALYEFSLILCGLDYARHDQRCSLLPLLRRAAMSIKHAFLPKNWGALLYAAVLIPFTNLFLTSNYISQLAVPEYIAEVINANTAMHIAYSIVFVLLCALSVCWILTLQYFILSGKDFRSAHQSAFGWIKEHPLQKLWMLFRWNLRVTIRCIFLLMLPLLLLFAALVAVGLYSNILMLALWRSFLLIPLPFFSYLLNCFVTLSIEAFLSTAYYEHDSSVTDKLQSDTTDNKPYRKKGRFFLAFTCIGVLLVWFALSIITAAMPGAADAFIAYFEPATTVTSHRGYSAVAPENTLPAFEAAISAGADCAELDVQMTKDGVVMITHDTNLKRTTGRNANIYDLTYDEVRELDAGSFMGAEFAGTKIPTLQEVLDQCKGRIRLNIEIKSSSQTPDLAEKTARLIVENGWVNDCVVTSLDYNSLVQVKQTAPEIKCGYILAVGVGNYYDLPAADFFSVESTFITSGMVQQLHQRGKTVSAWTIDREEDARKMKDLGVDDIITGDPLMVRSILAEDTDNEELLESLRDLFYELVPQRDDPFVTIQQMLADA